MNTTILRWNPLRELEEFQSRILNAFKPSTERQTNGAQMTGEEWTPSVNVWEDEEAYYIEADLPGLEKENVKVTLENRTLTLSGERAFHVTLTGVNVLFTNGTVWMVHFQRAAAFAKKRQSARKSFNPAGKLGDGVPAAFNSKYPAIPVVLQVVNVHAGAPSHEKCPELRMQKQVTG